MPLVLLGGVHAGCFELFGTERIRAVRDLKGKTVAIPELGSAHHVFVAAMASHVGIDPKRDINFVIHPPAESMQLLADRKIDAFMGFPPDPQELREKKIGHVIVNSGLDRPWSQYFCCIVAAHQEFVRKHPVATKRALRAILKATHFCAAEPERAARLVADKGYRYDYSLQTMKEIAVRAVARLRRRGHGPLLFAAAARGGHDQIDPQQDHRAGHRLALLQRAQARAEDLSGPSVQDRRRFLAALSAAAAAVIGPSHSSAPACAGDHDYPPGKTFRHLHRTAIYRRRTLAGGRFHRHPIRGAPTRRLSPAIGRGEVDFSMHFSPPSILAIEAGERLTIISGIHIGCFELFAHEGIRQHSRSQGQEGCPARLGPSAACLRQQHGRLCRA